MSKPNVGEYAGGGAAQAAPIVSTNPAMRVVLFSNASWNLWNFRASLADHLQRLEHEVVFAAPPDDYSDRLGATRSLVPVALDRKGKNPLLELVTLWRVIRLLRKTRPACVLSWTPKCNIYASLAGRLLGIPVIPTVTGLGFAFIKGGWIARVSSLLYRLAFSKAPVVLFQSPEDREHFVAAKWIAPQAARIVPGSGVSLTRFRPSERPLSERPESAEFVFMYVGRLLADKGVRELVEAIRLLRAEGLRLRLLVVGFTDPGNPAAIGDEEIRGWEAEGIEYLGRSDEIETMLGEANCVVLPSYREGMPRVLLEAAACAVPVIATDVPGCRDVLLDGKSGFLCRTRDAASLAAAMRRMLALPAAERANMGRAGRAFVEQSFSEEAVFAVYQQALEELRTRTHGPQPTFRPETALVNE
jgi:glycosyltransferase involved in cell wall biosynthesis